MVALALAFQPSLLYRTVLFVQKNLEHSARRALNETTTHSTFPAGIPYRNAHILEMNEVELCQSQVITTDCIHTALVCRTGPGRRRKSKLLREATGLAVFSFLERLALQAALLARRECIRLNQGSALHARSGPH